jgi:tetratricopeptide (TPR) repeat protein
MLNYPEEYGYYQAFKEKLAAEDGAFSPDEMREFYMFSINHCIRQTNRGERNLEHEVLYLYQKALEAGYLFENGYLSRFTYHNIVAAALRCRELDWAEQFIPKYNEFLEAAYRDSSLSFNQARLDYARNRFDSVLTLLQKANYRDPLLNLAAKTLLLKTYFVLGEHDLLQSHLDAMRNYIHRKKVIGYHRSNYLNIIRFTERLLYREPGNRQILEELRSEIEKEPVLTEKEWLLEQVKS